MGKSPEAKAPAEVIQVDKSPSVPRLDTIREETPEQVTNDEPCPCELRSPDQQQQEYYYSSQHRRWA
ncbi:hypothetical protein R1flu_028272 [Riccia fluitans]|uniref:Uncharacterized protein n=1 Tax=Riccia fluitans TaxID=41844 RepID=A0ABD1XL72_9MARC